MVGGAGKSYIMKAQWLTRASDAHSVESSNVSFKSHASSRRYLQQSCQAVSMEKEAEFSDLARIEGVVEHAVEFFKLWHDEARRLDPTKPDACCLATVSKDMKVSARSLILREFDNEGFVIVTDRRSRKIDNVNNVPTAAMCFLWDYFDDDKQHVTKQVRIEGTMKELEKHEYQHIYDREPVYCKIRSHICRQGCKVEWEDLKQQHDDILEEFRTKKTDLPMPDHFVGYKLYPTMLDFYLAKQNMIGDRVVYQRNSITDPWTHHRIAV